MLPTLIALSVTPVSLAWFGPDAPPPPPPPPPLPLVPSVPLVPPTTWPAVPACPAVVVPAAPPCCPAPVAVPVWIVVRLPSPPAFTKSLSESIVPHPAADATNRTASNRR